MYASNAVSHLLLPFPEQQTMASDSSTHREVCPFWSMPAMQCQLCRGGLFIPLNDHIEMYCQSIHYPQCLQFLLHSEDNRNPSGVNGRNRRN